MGDSKRRKTGIGREFTAAALLISTGVLTLPGKGVPVPVKHISRHSRSWQDYRTHYANGRSASTSWSGPSKLIISLSIIFRDEDVLPTPTGFRWQNQTVTLCAGSASDTKRKLHSPGQLQRTTGKCILSERGGLSRSGTVWQFGQESYTLVSR
jgi:hypothetical protein